MSDKVVVGNIGIHNVTKENISCKVSQHDTFTAITLDFGLTSVIMEAVGALHALPNIAETIRDSWHPSFNSSGPSKGITYISNVSLGKSDE